MKCGYIMVLEKLKLKKMNQINILKLLVVKKI